MRFTVTARLLAGIFLNLSLFAIGLLKVLEAASGCVPFFPLV
jgi:hypothetical protein